MLNIKTNIMTTGQLHFSVDNEEIKIVKALLCFRSFINLNGETTATNWKKTES